jgi:mitofusin
MNNRVCEVLNPDEKKKQDILDLKSRQTFEVFYPINCESLCSDFQENLEFRFSLGVLSMIRRFSNANPFRKEPIPRSLPATAPQTPSNEGRMVTSSQETDGLMLMLVERMAVSAGPQSQTTIGALALGGFMVKTIGWRIIGITCGVYALLYIYERMTWTNKAKERTFKRQYVNHATRKLKLIVDLTSANCSHQVQQELTRTFARLCRLVDEVVNEMNGEIGDLDVDIKRLADAADDAQQLRDKARALLNSLEKFSEKYLEFETQPQL